MNYTSFVLLETWNIDIMIDNKKEIVLQIVFHTVLYMVVEINNSSLFT